jgi:hypothetical protein
VTKAASRSAARGQAAVEFALASGLFLLVVGGLIQFAAILWSQNTINQIARDTARWAVTQSTSPCNSSEMRTAVTTTANALADKWSLIDHSAWPTAPTVDATPARGVGVDWYAIDPPEDIIIFDSDCPPSDNRVPWAVEVRINHSVPIFIPGLQFIAPSCGAPGFCITSTTELRMEPKRPE